MEDFKFGDWVVFSTKNWPSGVVAFQLSMDHSGSEDVTGLGLYTGRGQIIHTGPNGWLVEDESSGAIVRVSPGERIEPFKTPEAYTLTLGDLRKFLEKHKNAPDNIPVRITLPVEFNCDKNDLPEGHPETHEGSLYDSISVSNVVFSGEDKISESTTDEYITPEDQAPGTKWSFSVEFTASPEEVHDLLRECDDI